jgi:hypothetical protein
MGELHMTPQNLAKATTATGPRIPAQTQWCQKLAPAMVMKQASQALLTFTPGVPSIL